MTHCALSQRVSATNERVASRSCSRTPISIAIVIRALDLNPSRSQIRSRINYLQRS